MKTHKNKTTTKTKQTTITATKTPQKISQRLNKTKTKHKKETHPIFPNDFSHVVYLYFNQNLLSITNYVIEIILSVKCHFFSKSNCFH